MKTLVLGVTLGAFATAFAFSPAAPIQDKWKPYQFKVGERFEYKITMNDEDKKECFYAIDIKATDKKDQKGEELVEVSYTTRGTMKKSELGEKAVFGSWDMSGYAAMWAMSSAMYGSFFSDLTLKEGEKLSLFGMGIIKVTGKVKIAERDGFVCQFHAKQDDKEVLSQEWVIDAALALPLKTTWYEDGKAKHTMELVSYKK